MVKYSAILSKKSVIEYLSKYYDDIKETDFIEKLDKLSPVINDFLKLKYKDKLGLKLTCIIKKADTKKYTLTESFGR